MDRTAAAALLGVQPNAGRDEIQAAFRDRARTLHPDVATAASTDFDALTRARDVLLGSANAAKTSPSSGTGAAQTGTRPAPSGTRRPARSTDNGANLVVKAVLLMVAALVATIVVVAIWALAAGDDRVTTVPTEECVVVEPTSVLESSCDQPGAQRVVEQLSGAQTCASGLNALVAGSTTWCLEPVEPSLP